MSFQLPTNAGQLLGLGNKMEGGLTELGQKLGITQITPAKFQTYITAFAKADNAFNAGRSARQADSDAYQAGVVAMDGWLTVTKNVLAGRFGPRWSTAWAQAGFINNTTQLPAKIEDRIALAGRLVAFFTANPGNEVPTMQVTAAQGATLQNAVMAAQLALTNAVRALAGLSQAWTDAFKSLTDEMWSLIKILQATLNDDDPRWLAFGLPMPASPSTPGQPVNVSAQQDVQGNILVQCDPVALATRYRCRMMILGVDTDYQLAASATDPIMTIRGVEPGQRVQLIMQAVNGSLQGVASDPIQFAVLIAGARSAGARASVQDGEHAAATESPAARSHANGNGNGNGIGSGNGKGGGIHARG